MLLLQNFIAEEKIICFEMLFHGNNKVTLKTVTESLQAYVCICVVLSFAKKLKAS